MKVKAKSTPGSPGWVHGLQAVTSPLGAPGLKWVAGAHEATARWLKNYSPMQFLVAQAVIFWQLWVEIPVSFFQVLTRNMF